MKIPKENLVFEKKFSSGVFATYNKMPTFEFIQANQTHSNIVGDCTNWNNSNEGDGLVLLNSSNKIPLCMKTADCVPLLCIGELGTAMLHAGWKGIQLDIHMSPLVQKIRPFKFFLGPYASVKNYTVQEDFRKQFPNSQAFESRNNELFFNLGKELINRLKLTYPESQISESHICTISSKHLHSYRRNQTSERNWNLFFPLRGD